MSKYIWLLDAGHGGMKDGKYTTAPAKMHTFEDGLVFYEGVNNRAITDKLIGLTEREGVDYVTVYDPDLDTPRRVRIGAANRIHAKEKRCIYLSIHSDAMPDGSHGKGSGFAIYTSKGQTSSDKVADIFAERYQAAFKEFKFRKDFADGDADKEENFDVLANTRCPALLVENLFFDNRREAEFLLSPEGQQRIAETLLKGIIATEKMKPI